MEIAPHQNPLFLKTFFNVESKEAIDDIIGRIRVYLLIKEQRGK